MAVLKKISDLTPFVGAINANMQFEVNNAGSSPSVTSTQISEFVLDNPAITGSATVQNDLTVNGNFYQDNLHLRSSGNDIIFENLTNNGDIIIRGEDGFVTKDMALFDFSAMILELHVDTRLYWGNGGVFIRSTNNDLEFFNPILDQDITFSATPGAGTPVFLKIDGSESSVNVLDDIKFTLGTGQEGEIYIDSDDLYIRNIGSDDDLYISLNDGGVQKTFMFFDASAAVIEFQQNYVNDSGVDYLVLGDTFAFVYSADGIAATGTGLYFNVTDLYYDFRNSLNNPVFRVRADFASETDLIFNDLANNERWRMYGEGYMVITAPNDLGKQLMELNQQDTEQPFIDFQGTAAATTTATISTLNTSGATTDHLQIEINGTKAWIAVSTNNPS